MLKPHDFLVGLKPLVKSTMWISAALAEVVTAKTTALGGPRRKHEGMVQRICCFSLQVQIESQFLHCFESIGFIWIKLANVSVPLALASARFVWSKVLLLKTTLQ